MSGFDEKDLTRELHERSQDMGGHPIGLDAVKGSARRTQRRRRVAGAVAAMAVAVVVVPVGLSLTGTSTTGTGPVGQPTPTAASASPSPSDSPSASQSPSKPAGDGSIPLVVAGLPTGAPPAVPWIEGRTLHHDGTTDQLPGDYSDIASYRGGWLAVGMGKDGPTVTRIDPNGQVVSTKPGGYSIAVSGDGTQIAWVEDGALHRGLPSGMSDGEDTQPLPPGRPASPVGFAGGEVVYKFDAGNDIIHVTDLNGHDRALPGLIGARGTSDTGGFVAGETSYNSQDGTSCWALRDVMSDKNRLEDCDWTLESASPDGRYVVGQPSGADGTGTSVLAVMDSGSGAVVRKFASPRKPSAMAATWAWEDDQHLLATVWDGTDWWILRLGVDGSVEKAAGPVQGPDYDAPYHLIGR